MTFVGILSVLVAGLTGPDVQSRDVPADTMISLHRTSCFGPCPVYTVTIDARGRVTYEGEKFVRVVGRQTARIDTSLVAKLLAHAERIHFFDLRDAYRTVENPDGSTTMVTDLPSKIVSITMNGRTKRVEDYFGAPDVLQEFEAAIDEAAGSNRWVFTDEKVPKGQHLLVAGVYLRTADRVDDEDGAVGRAPRVGIPQKIKPPRFVPAMMSMAPSLLRSAT
jgi:uncharacterized protein DUF6438